MSLKALSAVWDESKASGADLLVLLALADWADPYGRCYPSLTQIAEKARTSRESVKRAIGRLADMGELERVSRGHEPNPNDDENDGPVSIRSQRRNAYRILLVPMSRRPASSGGGGGSGGGGQAGTPRAQQVGPARSHLVGSPRSHLSTQTTEPAKVGTPCAQPDPEGRNISGPKVGTFDPAHIRNKPSVEPSEELKAGGSAPGPHENPETPDDNVGVITKLVHTVIDLLGDEVDDEHLREAVLDRVVREKIRPYNKPAIFKAIDSARWQRRDRRRRLG